MRGLAILLLLTAACAQAGSESVSADVVLTQQQLDAEQARLAWLADPQDEQRIIWYGRRVGYTGDYEQAVRIYTEGLQLHPESARLLRHRGHRWISLRQFDRAIEDLETAARQIEGTADEVEPDGIPNARNQPTSTLHTNIWYHLALAQYCVGDFGAAAKAWARCLALADNVDMDCAARYWLFHSLYRSGDATAALELLDVVGADWDVIENHAYHRLLLLYRGQLEVAVLVAGGDPIEDATLGYGLARWAQLEGRVEDALRLLQDLAASGSAAFGCIAAEADLGR